MFVCEWSLKAIRLDENTHTEHGTQRRCDLALSPEVLRASDNGEEQEGGRKREEGDAEPQGSSSFIRIMVTVLFVGPHTSPAQCWAPCLWYLSPLLSPLMEETLISQREHKSGGLTEAGVSPYRASGAPSP